MSIVLAIIGRDTVGGFGWGNSPFGNNFDADTDEPTDAPTSAPTTSPTKSPTKSPTTPPTNGPTSRPTDSPMTSQPRLNNDWAETTMHQPVSIYPLRNDDYIPHGAGGSMTQPSHGSYYIVQDSVVYVPEDGFCGKDTFSYTVTAGEKSAAANIFITVECNERQAFSESPFYDTADEQPILNHDEAETDRNTQVTIPILDNDEYIPEGSNGNMTQPSHGTAFIEESDALYYPDRNFCGIDQFTYTITGPSGQYSDTANVTVNVLCTDGGDVPTYIPTYWPTYEPTPLTKTSDDDPGRTENEVTSVTGTAMPPSGAPGPGPTLRANKPTDTRRPITNEDDGQTNVNEEVSDSNEWEHGQRQT